MTPPDWQERPVKTIAHHIKPIWRRIGQVICFSLGGTILFLGTDGGRLVEVIGGAVFLACGLALRQQWLTHLRDKDSK